MTDSYNLKDEIPTLVKTTCTKKDVLMTINYAPQLFTYWYVHLNSIGTFVCVFQLKCIQNK